MSIQNLERAILAELKVVAANRKLKMADLLEWSTSEVKPQEGEVVIYLPDIGCHAAIKESLDKRPKP